MTIRNIALLVTALYLLPLQATLYEDAEDGDIIGNVPPNVRGWFTYDGTPAGSVISNQADAQKGGRVINFQGAGTSNGYMLGDWTPTSAGTWNNTTEFNINWCSKYSGSYVVYMRVYVANDKITSTGQNRGKQRYIYYTAVNYDGGGGDHNYIHHGLGTNTKDGTWHSLARDLQADLEEYEPGNTIVSVVAFLIRGSGRVDDIELTALPKSPTLNMKKTAVTLSDPLNSTTNPKAIPGAVLEYTITARNDSNGKADDGETAINDKVPANMKICVSTVADCVAPGLSGAVNTSGLTLGAVKYSNNNGSTYTYAASADVDGYDSSVTNVKYEFNGSFLGSCGLDRNIQLKMRMGLK